MEGPHKRSAAVIAAGITAILGSAFTVLVALVGLSMIAHVKRGTQLPFVLLAMTPAMMIFLSAIGVFGICAGVGLVRFKNWAHTSALVWSGITVPFIAIVVLMYALVPMPSNPDISANAAHFARFFVLLFYGSPLAVAVWWLILLNRLRIVAQFRSTVSGPMIAEMGDALRSAPQRHLSLPLPVVVLAWFFLMASLGFGFVILLRIPAALFGYAIQGPPGVAVYAIWCATNLITGVGLLGRKRWSFSLALTLKVFGVLSGGVTMLSPRFEAMTRVLIASMNLPVGTAYPPLLTHMRAFSAFSLLGPIIEIVILLRYRARFLALCKEGEQP